MSFENAIIYIKAGDYLGLDKLLSTMPNLARETQTGVSDYLILTEITPTLVSQSSSDTLLTIALETGQVNCATTIFQYNPILDKAYQITKKITISERVFGDDTTEHTGVITESDHPFTYVMHFNDLGLTQSAFNHICKYHLYHDVDSRYFILNTLTREGIDTTLFDTNLFAFSFGERPPIFANDVEAFKQWLIAKNMYVEGAQVTKDDCFRILMSKPNQVTKANLEKFNFDDLTLQTLYQHYMGNEPIRKIIFNFRPEVDPEAHQAQMLQREAEAQARLAQQQARTEVLRQANEARRLAEEKRYEEHRRLVASRKVQHPEKRDTSSLFKKKTTAPNKKTAPNPTKRHRR